MHLIHILNIKHVDNEMKQSNNSLQLQWWCGWAKSTPKQLIEAAENDAIRQTIERVMRPIGHIGIDVMVNIKKALYLFLFLLHLLSANDGQVVQILCIWCGGNNWIIC